MWMNFFQKFTFAGRNTSLGAFFPSTFFGVVSSLRLKKRVEREFQITNATAAVTGLYFNYLVSGGTLTDDLAGILGTALTLFLEHKLSHLIESSTDMSPQVSLAIANSIMVNVCNALYRILAIAENQEEQRPMPQPLPRL
jgi:hypothetical protein